MKLARITVLSTALCLTLTSCANLALVHERPIAPVATSWPSMLPSDEEAVSVEELGWKEFYGDERLRKLIELWH